MYSDEFEWNTDKKFAWPYKNQCFELIRLFLRRNDRGWILEVRCRCPLLVLNLQLSAVNKWFSCEPKNIKKGKNRKDLSFGKFLRRIFRRIIQMSARTLWIKGNKKNQSDFSLRLCKSLFKSASDIADMADINKDLQRRNEKSLWLFLFLAYLVLKTFFLAARKNFHEWKFLKEKLLPYNHIVSA